MFDMYTENPILAPIDETRYQNLAWLEQLLNLHTEPTHPPPPFPTPPSRGNTIEIHQICPPREDFYTTYI